MRTKYLACETLCNEIETILKRYNEDIKLHQMIWIESGLHNYPQKLHLTLQEQIEQIEDCDRLIFIMGRCGKSVADLKSGNFEMIIPKADDCISLLFGSDRERNEYGAANAAYYLTEGWLRGERNLWVEHLYAVEKYGEKTATSIAKMMYGHYRQLALLDTGTGDVEHLFENTQMIEETLGLKRKIVPVTLAYLEELIYGPWSTEKYYIVGPYEKLQSL